MRKGLTVVQVQQYGNWYYAIDFRLWFAEPAWNHNGQDNAFVRRYAVQVAMAHPDCLVRCL